MNTGSAPATIVLVHGGFVDGSGWRPVYDLLTQDGYPVAVVQHPTLSLPGDADAARLIIDAQDGPVVLVGHSYGGAVISEAGTHPNVAALVTSPRSRRTRTSRSTRSSAGSRPMGRSRRSCRPGTASCSWTGTISRRLRRRPAGRPGRFHGRLAGPWGVDALTGQVTDAAGRTKPSWYLVTTEDRVIPPAAQAPCPSGPGRTSWRWRAATPPTCPTRLW